MTSNLKVTGALLVSLVISEFANNKLDGGATEKVMSENNVTDKSAARVWKTLLPRSKGSSLDTIKKTLCAMRAFHYRNTFSYVHDGPRILTTRNYAAYQAGIRELQDQLDVAVSKLADEYESLKAKAKENLGHLFNEEDYPTLLDLSDAYDVRVKYSPMPVTENLLDLGLEPKDLAQMQADLERDLQSAMQAANRKLWCDLHDRLSSLISQINTDKASVHPKTMEGLCSLVEMLPRMNITNDSALDAMAARLTGILKSMKDPGMRHDAEFRGKLQSEASAVFGVMSTFMNARRTSPSVMEAKVEAHT